MRTIKSITDEIVSSKGQLSSLEKQWSSRMSKSEATKWRSGVRRIKAHLGILTELLMYLETGPREEFVVKQMEELGRKIQNRIDAFVPNPKATLAAEKKRYAKHLKDLGVPELKKRKQLMEILFKEPDMAVTKN